MSVPATLACQHPSVSGWTSYKKGCRCERCRAANTAFAKASRHKRFAKSKTSADVPHGLGGYLNWGCRCEVCSESHRAFLAAARSSRRSRIQDAPHGTDAGYGWGCRCDACREACLASERAKIRNDQSRGAATHHGDQWTGPELEVALRPDLTAAEAARILGRTVYAVANQRHLSRIDPRKRDLAGVVVEGVAS